MADLVEAVKYFEWFGGGGVVVAIVTWMFRRGDLRRGERRALNRAEVDDRARVTQDVLAWANQLSGRIDILNREIASNLAQHRQEIDHCEARNEVLEQQLIRLRDSVRQLEVDNARMSAEIRDLRVKLSGPITEG